MHPERPFHSPIVIVIVFVIPHNIIARITHIALDHFDFDRTPQDESFCLIRKT